MIYPTNWMALRFRCRYWRRRLYAAFGFCTCGCRMNRTGTGRLICPECGG